MINIIIICFYKLLHALNNVIPLVMLIQRQDLNKDVQKCHTKIFKTK